MKKHTITSERQYLIERQVKKNQTISKEYDPVFIDTKKMEESVPDSVKFASHMTIESEQALKFIINMVEFCPDRKQKKAGVVIKNVHEKEITKQVIYFFADDKYTCRRIDKLFRVKLPWILMQR